MTAVGKCLCGQIKVSIPKEAFNLPNNISLCHCKNCTQSSGSLGSINIILPESDVQIEGELKKYSDNNTDSGAIVQRSFCGNCGSPIQSTTSGIPGVRVVRVPLFDEIPQPGAEIYCKSMPSWNKPIDGTKHFDKMPTK